MGTWIKRREIADGARRIRNEKLREYQYKEGYARYPEERRVEWDGDDNVKHVWEQVKRAMVQSAREVCGSLRVAGVNPKSVWWNNKVKDGRERCLESTNRKR